MKWSNETKTEKEVIIRSTMNSRSFFSILVKKTKSYDTIETNEKSDI